MAYRVLVVEDDATTAVFLNAVLRQLGYEVTAVAPTAADGIKHAESGQPHVVIMDVSLTGATTGIQAGGWIRQNLDIPVIFVTAHADEATLRQAQSVEPYGFVLKPFDKNDIRVAIEIALTKHRIDVRLRWSQKRFATTLRAIGDAVISTDTNGTVDFMNAAAEALIGVPVGEALGKPLTSFVDLLDSQTRQPVALDQPWKSAAVLTNAAGREIPVAGSIAIISNDAKAGTGQVLVLRDISEERRLAELRERQRTERTMAEVSEAERRRLGQELHDGLGQMLTGIAFLCKKTEANLAKRKQPEATDVNEIGKLLRDTIETTREISRGLLPVPNRPDGLVMALERLADQITAQSGIECNFCAPLPVQISDPVRANHLFRIVQEAVNNAVKHAGATTIDICLHETGSVSIRDNGCGISLDQPLLGSGIDIMRHRAAAIDGTINISGASGGGTAVTCQFPVEA